MKDLIAVGTITEPPVLKIQNGHRYVFFNIAVAEKDATTSIIGVISKDTTLLPKLIPGTLVSVFGPLKIKIISGMPTGNIAVLTVNADSLTIISKATIKRVTTNTDFVDVPPIDETDIH